MATRSQTRRPINENPLWQAYVGFRYTILFYALLLMLVVMPIAATTGLPQTLLKLLLAVTLFAAVMPNAAGRTRIVFPSLLLLLIVVRIASDEGILPVAAGMVQIVVGLIGLLAAAGALRFVIRSREVGRETLYAALSTYLLAGVFFGELYWSIEQIAPGSFGAPEALSEQSSIYFSFVTLASLGYGDILPRTDITRGLAVFEVIGGQLFLAVMVARLIGLFRNPQSKP